MGLPCHDAAGLCACRWAVKVGPSASASRTADAAPLTVHRHAQRRAEVEAGRLCPGANKEAVGVVAVFGAEDRFEIEASAGPAQSESRSGKITVANIRREGMSIRKRARTLDLLHGKIEN
jgi:hypothetical protein